MEFREICYIANNDDYICVQYGVGVLKTSGRLLHRFDLEKKRK